MSFYWYLAAIVVLLALSAAFSGSETALFSLTRTRRDHLNATDPRAARRIESLLSRPARLLATLLFSNLLVNVTASSLFTLAVIGWAGATGRNAAVYLGIGGFVMTGVLLVFGEVTPKVAATHRPEGFARLTSPFIRLVALPAAPVAMLLTRLGALLAPRTGEPEHLSEDELHTMIEAGRERGVIVAREEEILWNLVGLEERTVSEVMTPRIDMKCLEAGATVRDAAALCREEGFSRLPVYEETVDHVVGVAYAKELLTATDPGAPVRDIMRPAYFVPEVVKLPVLLDELRKKGYHIAVVVDEFGQTAGLVTLEDVLEAIFGEIRDEFDDAAEDEPYVRLEDGSFEVEGDIDIATLNRLFRGAFDDVEHERLAGLIHDELARLPEPGDRLRVGDVEIVVREVDSNKLEKVVVRRKEGEGRGEG